MNEYPEIVTERFDGANFHIKYCLKFMNKYLKGILKPSLITMNIYDAINGNANKNVPTI